MVSCGAVHTQLGALTRWAEHGGELLPARYIRACVKHNKTDAADAAALPEAARTSDIRPLYLMKYARVLKVAASGPARCMLCRID